MSKRIKLTTESFIEEARKVHGDKYDYSKVNYINSTTEVEIICKKHNTSFFQKPRYHLMGRGCPLCGKEKAIAGAKSVSLTQEEVIKRFKEVHGDKYDYSKVIYKGRHQKVTIICNTCGLEFDQSVNSHLEGNGCSRCAHCYKPTTEEFIERAIKVHGDYYDYSEVEYVDAFTKVKIICPEHGPFYQTPADHVNGGKGCPVCKESKGERKVRLWLMSQNIKFSNYQKFEGLKYKKPLSVDFYADSLKLAIEYQGEQHFKPRNYGKMTKEEALEKLRLQQEKDKIKEEYFKNSDINLLCIHYKDYKKVDKILEKVILEKDYEYLKTTNSYIF